MVQIDKEKSLLFMFQFFKKVNNEGVVFTRMSLNSLIDENSDVFTPVSMSSLTWLQVGLTTKKESSFS
jgi:hypothetical protein